MNSTKVLPYLILISFSLSILGFLIDGDERIPNIWINVKEIVLMTIIFFMVLTLLFYLIKLIRHLI